MHVYLSSVICIEQSNGTSWLYVIAVSTQYSVQLENFLVYIMFDRFLFFSTFLFFVCSLDLLQNI